jgi:hypothetical protein
MDQGSRLKVTAVIGDLFPFDAPSVRAVAQKYPEAMFADTVLEIDVRDVGDELIQKLTDTLVDKDMAVQFVRPALNNTIALLVWPIGNPSVCNLQRRLAVDAAARFHFSSCWQWRDDGRDKVFKPFTRQDDDRTWVAGYYYGIPEGGPHGLWNHGTVVVRFADRDSTTIEEIAVYTKANGKAHKMLPGAEFTQVDEAPVTLL